MRSSRTDFWYQLERLTANVNVATVLGSIPASSNTVETEGQCNAEKSTLKKSIIAFRYFIKHMCAGIVLKV